MSQTTESLIVATFNIRRCIGTDGRHDPHRIAEIIESLGADAVALQEVDSPVEQNSRIDHLQYLAHATGMHSVAGPAVRRHYGGYGNGLLTRLPILDIHRHDLTVGRGEPRAALVVELQSGLGSLRLVTTHLGLLHRERIAQLNRLVEFLGQPSQSSLEVLAGDLNDAFRWSRLSRSLRKTFGSMPTPGTFPARRPLLPLDRICVRPPSCLAWVESVRNPLTKIASDHLPLRAALSEPT